MSKGDAVYYEECKYCNGASDSTCGQLSKKGTAICTRPKGHDGKHVACGGLVHKQEDW